MPRQTTQTPAAPEAEADALTVSTRPDAATVAGYADMTPDQLASPGDDLPGDEAMAADLDNPARARWGVRPIPAGLLPLAVRRALWRWDAALDLAADMEARARDLAADVDRDKAAADADLALVLAGMPAHHAADLAHERDSLTRAAADLRERATLVGENAHYVVGFDTEADPGRPQIPALLPYLRTLVGPAVADYLDTLDKLAQQRATIAAQVGEIAEWWRRAARPDMPRRGSLVAEQVTIPAELVSVTFDGVRNPTAVGVRFATVADHERAALAGLAAPTRSR